MKPVVLSLLVFVFAISSAKAIVVGEPILSGSGCPGNTARASVSPDGTAISILFDQFSVGAEPGTYSVKDVRINKTCRIRIPIEIPDGFNVETTKLQYRGYAQIPQNGRASIVTTGPAVRAVRGGVAHDSIRQDFSTMNDNFFVAHEVQQDFRGRCQNQAFLELTTDISVVGLMSRALTIIQGATQLSMDSVDMGEPGIELGIRASRCR